MTPVRLLLAGGPTTTPYKQPSFLFLYSTTESSFIPRSSTKWLARLLLLLVLLSALLIVNNDDTPPGVQVVQAIPPIQTRDYSSSVPASKPAPILGGVCNLRSGNPCVPEATCHPSAPIVGEALCSCPSGFGGDGKRPPEGQGCQNIDECLLGTHTCNTRTQDCIDLPGSFQCLCKSGYQIAPDASTCLDVDECASPGLNSCDPLTTKCYNTEGSYECRCVSDNMIVDPRTGRCRDMDECTDKGGIMNPCEQLCTNLNPGVKCGCRQGWTLNEDSRTCIDVDECANGTHTCAAFGIGGARCENTDGSYRCVCSAEKGWINSENDPKLCDNLNECKAHPYICGGAQSCCGDLMPPEKFACMMPVSSSSLASMTRSFPSSSTLGAPLGGFTSLGDAKATGLTGGNFIGGTVPVGPAAAVVQAAQSATAAATSPYTPSSTGRMSQASEIWNSGAAERMTESSSELLGPLIVVGCFEDNIEYAKWDISDSAQPAASAAACQSRCQRDPGCDYFTFQPASSQCFLKASNFGRTPSPSFVSGPKYCVNLLDTKDTAPKNAVAPNKNEALPYANSTGLIGTFLNRRGAFAAGVAPQSIIGRFLQDTKEISDAEGIDGNENDIIFTEYVVVIAGGRPIQDMHQEMYDEVSRRLESSGYKAVNEKQSRADTSTGEVSAITTDSESNDKREIPEEASKVDRAIARRLQRLGNVLRAAVGGAGLLSGRLPSNLVPRFGGSNQCPPGFDYAQDLYRARMRQQALQTVQSALVGTVNPDGSVTPGLTAETFTDGIVRNTNVLANKMANWYGELSAVPAEVMTASQGVTRIVDPTGGLGSGAGAMGMAAGLPTAASPGMIPGINPGMLSAIPLGTGLTATGAALGTGLAVAGVGKAVYGGGPGDSWVLDRTGASKKMAYGLMR